MRILTFSIGGAPRFGALLGDQVIDLPKAHALQRQAANQASDPAFPQTVLAFLEGGAVAHAAGQQVIDFARDQQDALRQGDALFAANTITFHPPIARPGKIICVGMNYRKHIAEMGREVPPYPVIFAKFPNTLIGHGQSIKVPKVSHMVDYEAELAFVIGRTAKDIPAEKAFDVIGGYTLFNDVSIRDYQTRTTQWLQGKTFDTSAPIGPAIVTADEVSNPEALDIRLRLNGMIMQDANTSDLLFTIPVLVQYLTEIMTLEPGDIIATGTPSGVGNARDPKVFLKAGDTVQVEIAGLGILENPVIAS